MFLYIKILMKNYNIIGKDQVSSKRISGNHLDVIRLKTVLKSIYYQG